MKSNPLYTKAFEYMAHGYSIIPLRRNKTPLLKENKIYQRERPATEDELELWWKKTPDANIGICTGKISGITVVDIDVSGGAQVSLDMFPKTYTVKTPTGGYHLYYEYDASIQQTANTFDHLPHVDIRNDGGYVVAPPSYCDYVKEKKRTMGYYTIHSSLPIVDFPKALFFKQDPKIKKGVNAILKSFPTLADGDGRNNALTSVVGKILNLVPFVDHEAIALPMALSANKQFKTPLDEKEVRTIFDSLHAREEQKPLSSVQFLRNDKGVVIVNIENLYLALKNDVLTEKMFRFNTFAGVIESNFEHTWEPIQRIDIVRVRAYLMRQYPYFTKIAHSEVEDAVLRLAETNRVSPPVEYLKSLAWDGTARLDTWLSTTYGTPDDVYHKAVGSNWLKGMIKRIVQPGCKFDYVLVLEGKQGIKKSTSLAVLGGEWHVETVFSPDNKDFFMIFGGKSIVEFSEGETLSRTEAKRLKAVITMQYDKYRPPYERSAKEFPRQCVFAMTTNQDQYLKDETGNRRWLPVAVQKVADIEWLTNNREQLFAEAYHRVITLKEMVWEFPEEETRAQQEMRQTVDPREEQIYYWYFNELKNSERENGITTRGAYVSAIHGNVPFGKEMGKLEEMVIGSILREKLYLEKRRTMEGGDRFYRYYPTDKSKTIAPLEGIPMKNPVTSPLDRF